MGVHDAPAWLLPAFARNVAEAGGTAPADDVRRTAEDLLERWTRPERHFHNLKHLVDVLARVDELDEEAHHPELVRLAAWYHGAVFDSAERKAYANKGGEDEAASAVLAREQLTGLGVPEKNAQRVAALVQALVRHSPDPHDIDCAVLCDADLAMLATEPQRYKAYLHDVRAEYAHLPLEDYLRARVRILHKLLARPSLFVSPLAQPWEEPARQNVSAELQRIEKELGRLDAERAGTATDGGADGHEPGTATGTGAP
jgi:predicted metal-dependent HD superfamily phosphohydrolase